MRLNSESEDSKARLFSRAFRLIVSGCLLLYSGLPGYPRYAWWISWEKPASDSSASRVEKNIFVIKLAYSIVLVRIETVFCSLAPQAPPGFRGPTTSSWTRAREGAKKTTLCTL